jgi:hypothetical protein
MNSVGGGVQRRCLAWIACCSVVASLSGCELPPPPAPVLAPVTGVVMFNGAPVDGATVEFLQEGAPFRSAGRTDTRGRFNLTSLTEGDGAPIGTHRVVIRVRPVVIDERAVAGVDGLNRRELDHKLGATAAVAIDESPLPQEDDLPAAPVAEVADFDGGDAFEAPGLEPTVGSSVASPREPAAEAAAREPAELPAKYGSPESTDLEFEVVSGRLNDFTIVLTN